MILIYIITLIGFGCCKPGGAIGDYGGYKDVFSNWKSREYGRKQDHVIAGEKKDNLKKEVINKKDTFNKEYKSYDDGYTNDDQNQWSYDEYVYDKNHYKDLNIRKHDYVLKCDINTKDCKDGRDCYDKASDRSEYDNCKNQHGDEGRYYDIDDRYSGNRYREEDYNDRYDKECYDNYKNSDDFNKCRQYNRRCRRYYRRSGAYPFNKNDWRNDRNCYDDDRNLVGLGRGDREDQLIRPCALDDRQCIRKYLAKNSNCKQTYGPIPDPLYLKRNTVYLTNANLTIVRTGFRVTGLASIKISKFYVNKDTKNLVMALAFQNLNQTTPKAYFRYKRAAKESIVLDAFATNEFKSGTFTAVIPKIPHLRLDLAEVHADIDDSMPRFVIGPSAVNKDPDVLASFAKIFELPPILAEEFLFSSQLFTAIYIQANLCDFGLKLTSV